ncbi:alpha-keto acid decarboxylase family protein [Saccharibacter sp. 17.LH.SD]|uniref:alpha-keto acid decarboxylase family protein n=1 Tax=Saccharibacter sp. 17.LH.SD TaxID=2689393 RepID=UPI001367D73C|nr:thiamine pyrophosphate-binding protein [Saccharibacter sp. 17.LH.SD]MXV45010.1 alpha-keto acid decarboxylase family protein [Saccharibacter sp. 17.LH.SD]
MQMTIGDFLARRLSEVGIRHLFGVPGDFNLSFLEQIEARQDITFVGNCNELNASYAADGYARTSGLSAVVTTWGVGDMSAIGGLAGAYAERVPVIHITGTPPVYAVQGRALLHHTLADGGYGNIGRCMAEFTVAQSRIMPENAVIEIDRVLQACWRERRPVHIQLPSDITHLLIDTPDAPLVLKDMAGDSRQVEDAAARIASALEKAEAPALLIDADADRFGVAALLEDLVKKRGIPYASLLPGKAILNERSAWYVGGYAGAASPPNVRQAIEESDCLIGVGVRLTDTSSGFFTSKIDPLHFIDMRAHDLSIGKNHIPAAPLKAVLQELVGRLEETSRPEPQQQPVESLETHTDDTLSHAALWPRIASFFKPHDVIIGEAGSSHTALSGMRLPPQSKYIAQPVWGAIGYTLPALFGSQLGQLSRRHLLFIGDGSFQLTAQELSSILRHDLKPIIFLINNSGYTVERMILGEHSSYNDIADWNYTELPRIFDPKTDIFTRVVSTVSALEKTLVKLESIGKAAFIELKLPMLDAPEALKKFGAVVANYDYGVHGPRNASQR